MAKGIRLSKEHGVNPSVSLCFWCGKDKNELVLFGTSYKDEKGKTAKAPSKIVMNYEPCDTCVSNMSKGVTLIEVIPSSTGAMIAEGGTKVQPTGRWLVIRKEAALQLFNSNKEKAFIHPTAYNTLLGLQGTKEVPSRINLCDSCSNTFSHCEGQGIKFACDEEPELPEAEADKVVECESYTLRED